MSLPALLTVEELAGYLHKRPATVRALAHRGAIAFIRCGRSMRFREDVVAQFLKEHTIPARDGSRFGAGHRGRAATC